MIHMFELSWVQVVTQVRPGVVVLQLPTLTHIRPK